MTVLGMVAEMERRFIRERQQAGIEAAKAKGIYKGRKPSVPVEKVREMHEAGHGPTAIAKALGISRMSVHRVLSGQERYRRIRADPSFSGAGEADTDKRNPAFLSPAACVI